MGEGETKGGAQPPHVPGYVLSAELGAGGTGSVWAGRREHDGLSVAVKVVPMGGQGQASRAGQAATELAVLGRVEVEGLVRLHEAIGLDTDPPSLALVLDRCDGGSLESVVRARGHLSAGESVTVLSPVARALAGLHAAGVVHGDVSPANVLLERSGRPLVADLGVARVAGEPPGDLYGTPGFVAPEVLQGARPTAASDVYAVGALAWWCVTGVAPAPLTHRRPLEEVAPAVPAAWREITLGALAREAGDRPTAAELALAYFDAARCEPLRLVVGGDATSMMTQRLRAAAVEHVEEPARAPSRSWRRRATAFAVVAVVLGGGAAAALVSSLVRPPRGTTAAVSTGAVAPASGGHPSPPPPRRADVASDHGAAQRDPRALMQSLADLRARAMNHGSARDIALLDVAGSVAHRQDAAALATLAAAGHSYTDVALRVRSARVIAATGRLARIEAVVDTAAYRVVATRGAPALRPAALGRALRFDVEWSAGRWRIARVAEATPAR